MANEQLVVVVGGAIAGSEAIFQLREKGVTVVCIEQNPLPYGKIEDGLPRWHVEQRKKEEEKIDTKMDHPLVYFVPSTQLGKQITIDEIYNKWKPSAVLLASGAWKDRPLGVGNIDDYIDKGLVYQNPLVYWFNHYHEPHYQGKQYHVPDGTIVIGGGLASIDVLKICQIELAKNALIKRGIEADVVALEHEGIAHFLQAHNLTWDSLGVKPTKFFYRRRVQDMPLSEAPEGATPEQMEKVFGVRRKILMNAQVKYLFEINECHLPQEPIVENGRLTGLKFIKTIVEGKKVIPQPGSEVSIKSNLVISSIGSIPNLIPGIPAKGETYDVKSIESGEIVGMSGLYAVGNAVTGKGNIRVSMMHARQVTDRIISQLKPITADQKQIILKQAKDLQAKSGYASHTYKSWVEKQLSLR